MHIDERVLSLDDWLFSGRRSGPMDPAAWQGRAWRPSIEIARLAEPKPTPRALGRTVVALAGGRYG
ncbi:MAG: hypothetical protein M0Z46_05895 [Actinomycetota bacterium]|jgi:hypothetical protein|nr:hypothetical protein [Actinomycetota bacterium]